MLLRLEVHETTVSSALDHHCDQVQFFVLTLVEFSGIRLCPSRIRSRESWIGFFLLIYLVFMANEWSEMEKLFWE